MWFDRELDFGLGNLVDALLDKLPRVVTSRSQDTQNIEGRLMSKREDKVATSEIATSALLSAELEDTEEQNERNRQKREKFLKRLHLRRTATVH